MPLPHRLARFNRRVSNPVLGTVAPFLPPMAVVIHRGRRSGRRYATPVLAFPTGGGFAIALTYGPDTDWVRNVQVARRCLLLRRGRELPLTDPVIVEGLQSLPAILHPVMRLLHVTQVLQLRLGAP
ncbi:nitroreductase family deazaflavin-dependent oxidoreductase [soil metagenome]